MVLDNVDLLVNSKYTVAQNMDKATDIHELFFGRGAYPRTVQGGSKRTTNRNGKIDKGRQLKLGVDVTYCK